MYFIYCIIKNFKLEEKVNLLVEIGYNGGKRRRGCRILKGDNYFN